MELLRSIIIGHGVRIGLLLLLMVATSACAGPTTPFGAIHDLMFAKKSSKKMTYEGPSSTATANIEFYPKRQLLHKVNEFRVKVIDKEGIPKSAKIKVFYEDYDMTDSFLGSAIHMVNGDQTELTLHYQHLRLLAKKPNHVRFVYLRNKTATPIVADYLPPYCSFDEKNPIQTLGGFRPPTYILKYMEHWSVYHNINPTLVAGLVAQESSFNTRAVSWAKAIGLTQMTNLADQDVSHKFKDWPRSSAIKKYPATVVKGMILSGKITAKEDYRLDPEKSIQGGIAYLKHLDNFWRRKANYELLSKVFGDPEIAMTDVVLASYNSGATRVKRALKKHGVNYLKSKHLNEARKYVRNINSYCYHFSQNHGGNVQ